MIKSLTMGTVLLSAMLLTGCGGGSSTPTATATATYKTLQDLEYKTLNMDIYFHNGSKKTLKEKMLFKERYYEGYLVDEILLSQNEAGLCQILQDKDFLYLCLGIVKSDKTDTGEIVYAHAFNISNSNQITGNFVVADSSDNLGNRLNSEDTSDALITGKATSNSSSSNKGLSKLNIEQLNLEINKSTVSNKVSSKETELNTILKKMAATIVAK